MSNVISEANWKFHWRLTESAGIMIYLADYKGRRVLWEGSLPYVTVDHQRADARRRARSGRGPRPVVGAARHAHAAGSGARAVVPRRRRAVGGVRGRARTSTRSCGGSTTTAGCARGSRSTAPASTTSTRTTRTGGSTSISTARATTRSSGSRTAAGSASSTRAGSRTAARPTRTATCGARSTSARGAAINIRPHSWDDAEVFAIRYHDGEWAPFSPRSAAGASRSRPPTSATSRSTATTSRCGTSRTSTSTSRSRTPPARGSGSRASASSPAPAPASRYFATQPFASAWRTYLRVTFQTSQFPPLPTSTHGVYA